MQACSLLSRTFRSSACLLHVLPSSICSRASVHNVLPTPRTDARTTLETPSTSSRPSARSSCVSDRFLPHSRDALHPIRPSLHLSSHLRSAPHLLVRPTRRRRPRLLVRQHVGNVSSTVARGSRTPSCLRKLGRDLLLRLWPQQQPTCVLPRPKLHQVDGDAPPRPRSSPRDDPRSAVAQHAALCNRADRTPRSDGRNRRPSTPWRTR